MKRDYSAKEREVIASVEQLSRHEGIVPANRAEPCIETDRAGKRMLGISLVHNRPGDKNESVAAAIRLAYDKIGFPAAELDQWSGPDRIVLTEANSDKLIAGIKQLLEERSTQADSPDRFTQFVTSKGDRDGLIKSTPFLKRDHNPEEVMPLGDFVRNCNTDCRQLGGDKIATFDYQGLIRDGDGDVVYKDVMATNGLLRSEGNAGIHIQSEGVINEYNVLPMRGPEDVREYRIVINIPAAIRAANNVYVQDDSCRSANDFKGIPQELEKIQKAETPIVIRPRLDPETGPLAREKMDAIHQGIIAHIERGGRLEEIRDLVDRMQELLSSDPRADVTSLLRRVNPTPSELPAEPRALADSPDRFRQVPILPRDTLTKPSAQVKQRLEREFPVTVEFIPSAVAGEGKYALHSDSNFSRKNLEKVRLFNIGDDQVKRTMQWRLPRDIIAEAVQGGLEMSEKQLTEALRKIPGLETAIVHNMYCLDAHEEGYVVMEADCSRSKLVGEDKDKKDQILLYNLHRKTITVPERQMHGALGIQSGQHRE